MVSKIDCHLTKHPNKFLAGQEGWAVSAVFSRGRFINTPLVTVKLLHPSQFCLARAEISHLQRSLYSGLYYYGLSKKKESSMTAFINISCASLLHSLAVCLPVCLVYKILGHLLISPVISALEKKGRCREVCRQFQLRYDAGSACAQ